MLRFDIEKLQVIPRSEIFILVFKLLIDKYIEIAEKKK